MALSLFFCTSFCIAQFAPHAYHYDIDNYPSVYGGKLEWKRFLRDHLVYPPTESAKKTEGTVQINFVVTKEGRGTSAAIIKSLSPLLDKEALRLFNMLEWFPATQLGEAVNIGHSVEIHFSLSKYKKWVKERGFDQCPYNDLPADTSFSVHESADKAPYYADPDKTFTEFINGNLEYPEMARRENIEGKIISTFIVEPDGRVSNIRIKNGGLGGGCNEEAIRVIGLSKWHPAVKNNMYVRYRMYHTLTFSVKNSFKDHSSGSQRNWGQ